MVINNPKYQWFRTPGLYFSLSEVAGGSALHRHPGSQLMGQPSFQVLAERKKTLKGLKPTLKHSDHQDTPDTRYFCLGVIMSHTSWASPESFRKCNLSLCPEGKEPELACGQSVLMMIRESHPDCRNNDYFQEIKIQAKGMRQKYAQTHTAWEKRSTEHADIRVKPKWQSAVERMHFNFNLNTLLLQDPLLDKSQCNNTLDHLEKFSFKCHN